MWLPTDRSGRGAAGRHVGLTLVPVKVLVVCPYSWATPGGVGAHVANLAAALRGRGHEVRIVAPDAADVPGVDLGRVAASRSRTTDRSPGSPSGRGSRCGSGWSSAGIGPTWSTCTSRSRRASAWLRCSPPACPSSRRSTRARRGRGPIGSPHRPCARCIGGSPGGSRCRRRRAGPSKRRSATSLRVIPNGVDWLGFAGLPEPAGSTVLFIGRFEPRKGRARAHRRLPGAEANGTRTRRSIMVGGGLGAARMRRGDPRGAARGRHVRRPRRAVGARPVDGPRGRRVRAVARWGELRHRPPRRDGRREAGGRLEHPGLRGGAPRRRRRAARASRAIPRRSPRRWRGSSTIPPARRRWERPAGNALAVTTGR